MKEYKRDRSTNPYYPVFWINQGLSEDEAVLKAKLLNRERSPRCAEFWIKRGLSQEEALEKLHSLQNHGAGNIGRKASEETKSKISQIVKERYDVSYWIKKYGEEDGRDRFQKFKESIADNGIKGYNARLAKGDNFRESSPRCAEYWIKRGFSPTEAEIAVARSNSRGLQFFIRKYGKEAGFLRWQERNKKWKESFLKNNDMKEVNLKRSINGGIGMYNDKTISGIADLFFYIIYLQDSSGSFLYKYGLTKQDTICKRWSVSLNYNLVVWIKLKATEALKIEQDFSKVFLGSYSPEVIRTRECFADTESNKQIMVSLLENHNVISAD